MVDKQGNMYIAADNKVQSISDDTTGATIDWTYTFGGGGTVNSGPIFHDNAVYFSTDNSEYYVINKTTGGILTNWPKSVASGNADTGPWIETEVYDLVIFATDAGDLDAFTLE